MRLRSMYFDCVGIDTVSLEESYRCHTSERELMVDLCFYRSIECHELQKIDRRLGEKRLPYCEHLNPSPHHCTGLAQRILWKLGCGRRLLPHIWNPCCSSLVDFQEKGISSRVGSGNP